MDDVTRIAVNKWLEKARDDLRVAKILLKEEDIPVDAVCFHAQQSAEKALKAFLVSVDSHVERTHSLPRLLELCRQHCEAFSQFEDLAPELTIYAVTGRYPDDWAAPVNQEEALAAATRAETVFSFVEHQLRVSNE